ncbi:MAG: hypothetical protein ABI847_04355 [Anaerolineales bacterium]
MREDFESYSNALILIMAVSLTLAGLLLAVSRPLDWTDPLAVWMRGGAVAIVVGNVLLNLIGWLWDWRTR